MKRPPPGPRIYVGLPDRQVVLCLTPKVASSAIITALLTHYSVDATGILHLNPALPFMDRAAVERHVPHWRTAMFVRNPFDRLASCYWFHIRQTKLAYCANMRRLGFTMRMRFAQFLEKAASDPDADPHTAVQLRQFEDRADFVGKVESMVRDWSRFRRFTGLPLPDLGRTNASDRPDQSYRQFYGRRERKLVERTWGESLEAFGYGF